MQALAVGLQVAGGLYSAAAAEQQGNEQKVEADYVARQERQNAGQQEAAGQRAAQDQLRKKDYIESSLQAKAAASGGGATDPTIVSIMGDLEQEGQLRARTASYDYSDKARMMRNQANVQEFQGDLDKQAGHIKAVSDLFATAESSASMMSKYSPTGSGYGSGAGGYG